MEEQIRTETVFSGNLLTVRSDTVRLANSRTSTREVVEHPGAVAIIPLTDDGKILLVEHFRYPVGRTMLEIPAGTREPHERAIETARRELEEETGLQAESMIEIARFYSSPGWATEEIVLFRAESLSPSGHGPDHDEILDVIGVSPARIPGLMRDGRIADAKTIIAAQMITAHFR
ncbi:MAG: NUDIX hydrolase [Thermomicrobiales bacterium]